MLLFGVSITVISPFGFIITSVISFVAGLAGRQALLKIASQTQATQAEQSLWYYRAHSALYSSQRALISPAIYRDLKKRQVKSQRVIPNT